MINLINADRILKQLYLSMVEGVLNKAKEQSEEKEKKEEEKNE